MYCDTIPNSHDSTILSNSGLGITSFSTGREAMERARESGIVESPMFPPVSLAFCTSVTSLIMQGAVEQDHHFNSPLEHGAGPSIAQSDFWYQSNPTPGSNVRGEATSGATALTTFELVRGVEQIRLMCERLTTQGELGTSHRRGDSTAERWRDPAMPRWHLWPAASNLSDSVDVVDVAEGIKDLGLAPLKPVSGQGASTSATSTQAANRSRTCNPPLTTVPNSETCLWLHWLMSHRVYR